MLVIKTTDGKIVEVEAEPDGRVSLLVYSESEGGNVTYMTREETRSVIAGLEEAIK